MKQLQKLLLQPDWPRMRQLIAKRLNISEEEVQAMQDKGDSLAKVELAMAVEEILDDLKS
jgi:acyl carrier protein